tara:strand:+ start:24842 stop:25231 length:390 start_codon:yes stop_codon:yes gene_type:complete
VSGKNETKLWKLIKQRTPRIRWNRIENSVNRGFPDLIGSQANSHFFTVELKVANASDTVVFSAHQVAFHLTNYGSKFIMTTSRCQSAVKLFQGTIASEPRVKLTNHEPLFVVHDTHDLVQWDMLQDLLV